jgi:hypothetical protein
MIQVIVIGGEPASGKTTLMRALKGESVQGSFARADGGVNRSIRYELSKQLPFVIILGHYSGEANDGTDRMDMAIQPHVIGWLKEINESADHEGWTVLFEGDRLFNEKFITQVRGFCRLRLYILRAGIQTIINRHYERNDKQTDKFIQGRRKKYLNIALRYEARIVKHETEADTELIAKEIREECAKILPKPTMDR